GAEGADIGHERPAGLVRSRRVRTGDERGRPRHRGGGSQERAPGMLEYDHDETQAFTSRPFTKVQAPHPPSASIKEGARAALPALPQSRSSHFDDGSTSLSSICWAQRMDRCSSSAVTDPAAFSRDNVPVASLRNSTLNPRWTAWRAVVSQHMCVM